MANIKLRLFSKKVQGTKKAFRRYWTIMNIIVKGEESKGLQAKTLNVKFRSDVDTKTLTRGILTLKEDQINAPFIYEITKDDLGNDVYPVVWIRGYESFEEQIQHHTQSSFIIDEFETPETTID